MSRANVSASKAGAEGARYGWIITHSERPAILASWRFTFSSANPRHRGMTIMARDGEAEQRQQIPG
jgi:hypothetical protein